MEPTSAIDCGAAVSVSGNEETITGETVENEAV